LNVDQLILDITSKLIAFSVGGGSVYGIIRWLGNRAIAEHDDRMNRLSQGQDRLSEQLSVQGDDITRQLTDLRLEVARDYVSKKDSEASTVRFEKRLDRIDDRLDEVLKRLS
jgi:phage-related tail protein